MKTEKLPKNLAEVEKITGISFEQVKEALKAIPAIILPELKKANMFNQFVWESIIESINIASAKDGKTPWKPDWLNPNQWKYYPYARLKKDDNNPAAFGFAYAYFAGWDTYTFVGERLLVENSDNALYAIRTFPNEYLAMTLSAKEGL